MTGATIGSSTVASSFLFYHCLKRLSLLALLPTLALCSSYSLNFQEINGSMSLSDYFYTRTLLRM
jgi:hypothetical protein